MSTTAARQRAKRREAIVAAASELFAERGLSGAGIDEIGARAGITGPGIYRYFAGKEALLAAVCVEAVERFAAPATPAEPELGALAARAVAAGLDDPPLLRAYLRERHRVEGEARTELVRAERATFDAWRRAVHAVDPDVRPRDVALRQRAVMTSVSEVAARPGAGVRPALDRLLTSSVVAVMSVPPVAPQPRPVRSPSWSLAPGRRDEILRAALRLFRQRGYDGVGIDEIAAAVGIAGPTIYAHYGSKAELLADAHERASIRITAAVDDAVDVAASASEALDRLAAAHLGVASRNPDLIVVTSRETPRLEPHDVERLTRRARDIIEVWLAVVGELRPELDGTEARALVHGVFPLVNQIAYRLADPRDGVPLVRAWVRPDGAGP